MKAVPLEPKKQEITNATHYVQMDKHERPPVDEVIEFARKSDAVAAYAGEEIYLVKLGDETAMCGMNRSTLDAGLTQ